MTTRYWTKKNTEEWKEVTLEQFMAAERMCGFYPKEGLGPATGGFVSTTSHGEIKGAITTKDGEHPDDPIGSKF